MRVSEDEPTRKAAYEAMRSVGPFVSEAFLGIVKDRNKLARLMGYQDFYDMKVCCLVTGMGGHRQQLLKRACCVLA
jgi:Zn-dependent oligopeptidase